MTNIPEKTISVYITAKDTGQKVEQVNLSYLLARNAIESPTIKLNKNGTRQEILGFGGAFTEAAASVYHKLDLEKREEIIQAYFGSNGNGYNMGRTHINSCDFSLGNYAHCETTGDKELKDFSISRDKKMLIPFIKDAIDKVKTPIHIMASPWSPPAWMKTNGQMNYGGKLKKELYAIISHHTKKDPEQVWKDSDRDYWMRSEEAKEYGMIDEVLMRNPK